jgi:protein TonB
MPGRLSTIVVAAIALLAPSTVGGRTLVATDDATAVGVSRQAPRIRVGGPITAPTKLKHVDPAYPADAKAAGVDGVVILEIVVDTKGLVSETRVLKSIPLLDEAATEAVRQWEYTPTLLNGEPCELIMTVTINFQLKA